MSGKCSKEIFDLPPKLGFWSRENITSEKRSSDLKTKA